MRLGDKDYEPRYPIMSCISLENVTGKSLFELVDELRKGKVPGVGILSAMIWAGVLVDEPKITLNEVTELLQDAKPGYFRHAYRECFEVLLAATSRLVIEENGDSDEEKAESEEPEKN